MAIPFKCESCGFSGQAKDELAGRIVKCPRCENSMQLLTADWAVDQSQPMPDELETADAEPAFRSHPASPVCSPIKHPGRLPFGYGVAAGIGLWWTILAAIWLLLQEFRNIVHPPTYSDDASLWLCGVISLAIGCGLFVGGIWPVLKWLGRNDERG